MPETTVSINTTPLFKKVCRESFFQFVKEFWDVVSKEPPVYNWHMEYLCGQMQLIAQRVKNRQPSPHDYLINIPPGSSKSTICSVMFPAWVWTFMPEAQFICVSFAYSVAHDLALRCRDVVDSPRYKELFPEVGGLRDDANAVGMFINHKRGFRLAVGAGAPTGFHGHFIIVDDPINPRQTVVDADREKVLSFMTDTLPTRRVNKSVAPMIVIMQRLHEQDPSALLLGRINGKKWGPVKHICLPWSLHHDWGDGRLVPLVSPASLVAKYKENGDLLDKVRLTREVASGFQSKGQYQFSGQFEQNPTPIGGGMFKYERIKYEPRPHKFKRMVRYWDKAATAGGGCNSVGALMALDYEDRIWILDIEAGQWDTDVRESRMKAVAMRDSKKVPIGIELEPGSGGLDSARQTIRKTLVGFSVFTDRPTGDKVTRADPLSVQVNQGNVYIPDENLPWVPALLEEMRGFPLSELKDRIDACSGAFKRIFSSVTVGGGWR